MHTNTSYISIASYTTFSKKVYHDIIFSYHIFGKALGTAPVVLVNHALTGNAQVCGDTGWWSEIVGVEKTIDTSIFTVIAFNIPGNGEDNYLIENYKDFTARDIAQLFYLGLKQLHIDTLYAVIGGSLGGAIAWELAALYPTFIENLVPIASDWKASDWVLANTKIQDQILLNSKDPVHDARLHAMLCYRTPASFKDKFNRTKHPDLGIYNVESWLLHHGKKLRKRFQLSSYKLLNHLLSTIDITRDREDFIQVAKAIKANIYIVGINSDLFFTPQENRQTYDLLSKVKKNVYYKEITSLHGHDAFLIEFDQINELLQEVFTK